MTTVLGKRKSRAQAEPPVSAADARAIFARHFEAQFEPLAPEATPRQEPKPESDASDEGDDDEEEGWSGISEDEDSPASSVEVVDYTAAPKPPPTTLSKRETRALLSSRARSLTEPDAANAPGASKPKAPTTTEEDSASLLKNDLALQRLLAESHLFSSPHATSFAAPTAATAHEHQGRNRHLATDLRLAALGSKTSIYKQAKMPMAMRKGINAAADTRESRRRREAKENGIVLERPAPGAAGTGAGASKKKRTAGRREAAVDAPAVGSLRGSMLKLSKKDIMEIQGDDKKRGAKGKKRRR